MGINPAVDPNEIVMNTVIGSGASGLLVALSMQFSNSNMEFSHMSKGDNKNNNANNRSMQGAGYYYNAKLVCNAVMAGLVSVAGSSASVDLLSASIIGTVGGFLYLNSKALMETY